MLLQVNQSLQQIKDSLPDDVFGHISILAVGNLYQLPPVLQPMLFEQTSNAKTFLCTTLEAYGRIVLSYLN